MFSVYLFVFGEWTSDGGRAASAASRPGGIGRVFGRAVEILDFFDASINRIAAWVIGTRCMIKSLLMAMLQPVEQLRAFEAEGDYTSRLAMLEELKTLPFGAVWDYYCQRQSVPVAEKWLADVRAYESDVLAKRT